MKVIAIAALAAISAGLCCADTAVDKMVGTWKYVPEKAVPPEKNLTSEVIRIAKIGPYTVRDETDQVTSSGNKRTMTQIQTCDGKESHRQGAPLDTTWICDPKTYNFVVKRSGRVVMNVKTEFSADGRTVTYHRKRLDPSGHWVEDTRVWERQ